MRFLPRLFKHKDETGLGDLQLDVDLKAPESRSMPTFEQSMNMQSPGAQFERESSFEQHKGYSLEQEIKLLSSKMDTLIAKMDNMNQRIANLERIASEAQR